MSEDVGSAVSGFGAGVGRVTGSMWGGLRHGLGRAAAVVTVQKAAADGREGGGGAGAGPDGTPADAASLQAAEVGAPPPL